VNTALLDVNVLIALADNAHVHHDMAHAWFDKIGATSFATCPLTQNGLLRVMGHPRYPNGPGTPKAMLDFLDALCDLGGHVFWPDCISLTKASLFNRDHFSPSEHLTDVYLLGLAVSNSGRLATFDRRIASKAVVGSQQALELIHA
jgi:uncharacterized protein